MKGRRSESSLYVLQVKSGCLGYIDDDCKSPKKMTFYNDAGIGLEGEIVEARSNSHVIGDSFDHLVSHALSCTFKNNGVCSKEHESICFGSLNEVINDNDLVCLNDGKGVLNMRYDVYLE